ncbi:two-component system response regulator KdpE, partial [Escherichia coli]|uniref:response regulator n=1 Tax=Escherichia coli TaxID=562 RepID=UPI002861DBC8|nr:two-component system response regulator KdpE [Escherichia coli]
PIIVLSARADTHDIVAALESGADDYVTKPFEVKEVSARLRALRRRPPAVSRSPEESAVVLDSRDAPLVLDLGAGVVRRGT